MLITKRKLNQIIREELLKELMGPDIHRAMARSQQTAVAPKELTPIVKILDPTAITTWTDPEWQQDLINAHDAATDPGTTSPATVGVLLVTAAAAIPIFGKFVGIPARIARQALKSGGKKATKHLAKKAFTKVAKDPKKFAAEIKTVTKAGKKATKAGNVNIDTGRLASAVNDLVMSPTMQKIFARVALKASAAAGSKVSPTAILRTIIALQGAWYLFKLKAIGDSVVDAGKGALQYLGLSDSPSNKLQPLFDKVFEKNPGASEEELAGALYTVMEKRAGELDEDQAAAELAELLKILRARHKKIKKLKKKQ